VTQDKGNAYGLAWPGLAASGRPQLTVCDGRLLVVGMRTAGAEPPGAAGQTAGVLQHKETVGLGRQAWEPLGNSQRHADLEPSRWKQNSSAVLTSLYLSLYQFISVSISLSQSLSVYLNIYQFISVFISLSHYLSVYLNIYQFISVFEFISLFISLSQYLSVYLNIYQFI
jgi:hypothetical protein